MADDTFDAADDETRRTPRIALAERSHIAGGSHNPYAKYTPDAVATSIAMKYLPMLEASLHRMGIHVATGVEIEFDAGKTENAALINYVNRHRGRVIEQLTEQLGNGPAPSRLWRLGQAIGSFVGLEIESPQRFRAGPVQHAYVDADGDAEITTKPASPVRTVRYVQGIKRVLAEVSQEAQADLKAEGREPGPSARHIQRDLKSRGLTQVDRLMFGAIDGSKAYGEHLNLSIHQVKPTKTNFADFDLGKANLTGDPGWRQLLAYAISIHTMQDAALFLGGPLTLARYRNNKHVSRDPLDNAVTAIDYSSRGYRHRCSEDYPQYRKMQAVADIGLGDQSGTLTPAESARIEVRMPDSTSNIALTMLAVLSAVHFAVDVVRQQHHGHLPKTLNANQIQNAIGTMNALHTRCRFYPKTPQGAMERIQTESLVVRELYLLAMAKEGEHANEANRDLRYFLSEIDARTTHLFAGDEGKGTGRG